jgi:hypothetical protein
MGSLSRPRSESRSRMNSKGVFSTTYFAKKSSMRLANSSRSPVIRLNSLCAGLLNVWKPPSFDCAGSFSARAK